jgi:hypothetical protein
MATSEQKIEPQGAPPLFDGGPERVINGPWVVQQRLPLLPRERTSDHFRKVPIPDSCTAANVDQSLTSVASNCIELGTSMPSALAVLKLITNSNLVDLDLFDIASSPFHCRNRARAAQKPVVRTDVRLLGNSCSSRTRSESAGRLPRISPYRIGTSRREFVLFPVHGAFHSWVPFGLALAEPLLVDPLVRVVLTQCQKRFVHVLAQWTAGRKNDAVVFIMEHITNDPR